MNPRPANWQHLAAFLWLRWRLWVNQWRRAGALIVIIMTIVAAVVVAMAVPSFIGCIVAGNFLIPRAAPVHLMYAWDGVLFAFAFFWMIGLVTELQRTEPLALSKFLHLPVSVKSAFLINFISSLLRLSLIMFVPVMLGFCVSLVSVKGPLFLLTLPLLAAFLLMVTALTYQFQGWLASLMSNPRRRRTVIVATTMAFVLIVQLPNLLNISTGFWGSKQRVAQSQAMYDELAELRKQGLPNEENERQDREIRERYANEFKQAQQKTLQKLEQTARVVNLAVPLGWLPLGVLALAEGHALPAILGFLGMTLIGSASLWRAYRTTIGLYQGRFTTQASRPAAPVTAPDRARPESADKAIASKVSPRGPGLLLVERRLPGFSEEVSAIALGCLRALMRSPEAKMMILTLVVLSVVFGAMMWNAPPKIPEIARPLAAIGAMAFVMVCMLQFMSNQFGFDRDGFRVFVLCAAPRRDILLGKNLSFAPIVLGAAAVALIFTQFICPMRLDHFVAMFPQFVSMFLLFCVATNLLSIYAPLYIAAGSLKPANPKIGTILLQMAMFMILFPLTQAPTLLPLGIEAGLAYKFPDQRWIAGTPICLVCTLLECAAVIGLYRFLLNWQGTLLQAREQTILDRVTNRA